MNVNIDLPQFMRKAGQQLRTEQLFGLDVAPVREAAPTVPLPDRSEPVAARAPVAHVKDGEIHAASWGRPGRGQRSRQAASPPGAPQVSRAATEPLAPTPAPSPTSTDRDGRIQLLYEMDVNEIKVCRRCRLCSGRTQTVFGEGDPEAAVMFIGEGPGADEDRLGRPFVGRAGGLLDKMINAMNFKREEVFIANVVKCRPPNNRAPNPDEVQACLDYLTRQIAIVQPKVIVTLGGPAAKAVINAKTGVMSIRGKWHQYHGLEPHGPTIPVMPTFHPAYVLRAYNQDTRGKVWSDLKQVIAFLGK